MYCVAHSLAADELVWVGLAVHDVVRAPCGLHSVHALLKGHTAVKRCLVVLGVTQHAGMTPSRSFSYLQMYCLFVSTWYHLVSACSSAYVYLYVPSYVFICTVVCIQYTHHAVSWMMLPPTSCVRDTSKIHINTFINTCSFMYQGGGGDSHQWAARCFLYRYTRTAASGEGTQTSHVSMCIVQYRETSIQPHVLNTEHMKAPGMQADT